MCGGGGRCHEFCRSKLCKSSHAMVFESRSLMHEVRACLAGSAATIFALHHSSLVAFGAQWLHTVRLEATKGMQRRRALRTQENWRSAIHAVDGRSSATAIRRHAIHATRRRRRRSSRSRSSTMRRCGRYKRRRQLSHGGWGACSMQFDRRRYRGHSHDWYFRLLQWRCLLQHRGWLRF
jgi:hypothetical protein